MWADEAAHHTSSHAGVSSSYTGDLSRDQAVVRLQAGARSYLARKQLRLQQQQQEDALVLVQVGRAGIVGFRCYCNRSGMTPTRFWGYQEVVTVPQLAASRCVRTAWLSKASCIDSVCAAANQRHSLGCIQVLGHVGQTGCCRAAEFGTITSTGPVCLRSWALRPSVTRF